MVYLTEDRDSYIVNINNYPYSRKERKIGRNGKERTVIYGLDGNMEKTNQVIYPKKLYNKQYIIDNIMHKYERCPLCRIGRYVNTTFLPKNTSILPYIFVGVAMFTPAILFGIKYFMDKSIEP